MKKLFKGNVKLSMAIMDDERSVGILMKMFKLLLT